MCETELIGAILFIDFEVVIITLLVINKIKPDTTKICNLGAKTI